MLISGFGVLAAAIAFGLSGCQAAPGVDRGVAPDSVVLPPPQVEWEPAPPVLEPGAEIAVLEGNPEESGPFTIRLRMPDGYVIAPHVHPHFERVTVLEGTFHLVAGEGLDGGVAQARFGATTTISIIIAAGLAPVLGVLSDFFGIKKKLLGLFMALGVVAVAGMYFIQHGNWLLASFLFFLTNIGVMSSFVFYDALLPHIAREDEMDRVSTAGYALGYVGGGTCLALVLLLIIYPGWFGLPSGEELTPAESTLPVRLAFVGVGLWWAVFSIPLFLRVPEPPWTAREKVKNPVKAGFRSLAGTFRELRRFKQAFVMLTAFFLYSDGIGTIIRMAVIYGQGIGLDRNVMIFGILITQFVGIPCAFLFGSMAGWMGTKRAIFVGLLVYMFIAVMGYVMATETHFLALAILVGTVQGGTQALSRSLFAGLIPRSKSGEFFGFFGVVERFSGSMGTLMITVVTYLTGSPRLGVLGVIVFFLAGGLILSLVDVDEGRKAARKAEEDFGFGI